MNIKREWATPITAGAFILMAVTGILMFFHLDTGLNQAAHEWLGWVLLAGVGLHVITNWRPFKGHLRNRLGKSLIAVFVVVLGLSFMPIAEKEGAGGPPFFAPVKALAQLPISTLATVAQTSPEQMHTRLQQAGLQITSDDQSVSDLVGPDARRQVDVIIKVFKPAS